MAWLLWLTLSLCGGAFAAPATTPSGLPPVVLDSSTKSVHLAQRSAWWVDPGGQLTVQDVAQRQADLPFGLRAAQHRLRLENKAALWIGFNAWARDNSSHWELELARSGTDRVSLFFRDADGNWLEQHAGDRLPVNAWASPDRYPVFQLAPRSDAPVAYWVRIEHARVPFSGELFIHSHDQLREQRIHQQFALGAYFGMTLLLVVVAVANALVFRDSSFAAYAIYITLLGLSLAASLGVGGQFLWPDSARWNGAAEFVLMPLAAVAGLLFAVQAGQINPYLGFTPVLKAFIAAVIGGFGSLLGTVLGGLIIGVSETLAARYLPPGFKEIVAYLIMLGVLILRPHGLFSTLQRKKV